MTQAPITITADAPEGFVEAALADGIELRFRADTYGIENAIGGCCPACGRYEGMRWIASVCPLPPALHGFGGVESRGMVRTFVESWDRFACDYCGHHYAIESHVAEAMPTCSCGKPATRDASEPWWVDDWRAMDQEAFREMARQRRCCSTRCADEAGDAIAAELRDEESLRETEESLMAGRL